MALIDGLGGSKRWNRWLSVVDRVALSAWNTQNSLIKSDLSYDSTYLQIIFNITIIYSIKI